MNGVVNLSVLDGWWYEGYREGAGWALTDKRTYQNQGYQDRLDASTIYTMLEQEIIPLYFNREQKPFSEQWVRTVKNSIAMIAPHYTMKRQLDDYYDRFYNPEASRFKRLASNNYAEARSIAAWKEQVALRWDDIQVVKTEYSDDIVQGHLVSDKEFTVKHIIDEKGLDDAIGVDCVILTTNPANSEDVIYKVLPMEMVSHDNNLHTFELHSSIDLAGAFKVAYRMYPKHDAAPHRQDMSYVKWFV